jgi:hypothetical protein
MYADAPHPLRLLRTCRERPCDRRTAEKRNELTPPHVGHGASSPPATRGPVSSACHNAAGKSFGQGPEFRSVAQNPPRYTLRGKALWRLHCFLFPDCCRRGGASEKTSVARVLSVSKQPATGLSTRTRGLGRLHPLPSAAHVPRSSPAACHQTNLEDALIYNQAGDSCRMASLPAEVYPGKQTQ